MSCDTGGKKKKVYTGDQVGDYNFVGDYGFVDGGPDSIQIASGTIGTQFFPDYSNRRPWLRADAVFSDQLLDACYPTMGLRWFAEVTLSNGVTFRVSTQAFYVTDSQGNDQFYDARAEKAPSIQLSTGEWLQPNFQVSDLQLSLNNRDGHYNSYLPNGSNYVQWNNASVIIKVGFEGLYSNYFTLFEGYITTIEGLTTTRDTVEIKAYSKMAKDEVEFPTRTFDTATFPEMEDTQNGKAVPIVYGDWADYATVEPYGNLEAVCTNGLAQRPVALFNFIVSDSEITSILGVYLHRGDRTADSPIGPYHLSTDAISYDLLNGQFNIDPKVPCIDTPHTLLQDFSAGPGTTSSVITTDGQTDFIQSGVQVGDFVIDESTVTASIAIGNILFISGIKGDPGNTVSVTMEYYTPSYYLLSKDGITKINGTCIASIPNPSTNPNDILIQIPQYTDKFGNVQNAGTASKIVAAINANTAVKAILRTKYVGTVPADPTLYNQFTTSSGVYQAPFAKTLLSNGQSAGAIATITEVTAFALTMDGTIDFVPNSKVQIQTVKVQYLKSDKYSVVCQGKPVAKLSTTLLSDVSKLITAPVGLIIDPSDSTYWMGDNTTQKVYNADFNGNILSQIPFSSIDSSLTQISSVSLNASGQVFVTDPVNNIVYGFDPVTLSVLLKLKTVSITSFPAGTLAAIAPQPDGQLWLAVNQTATTKLVLIDINGISGITITRTLTNTTWDVAAFKLTGFTYDSSNDQLGLADIGTDTFYRLNAETGALVSSFAMSTVNPNLVNPSGVNIAPDATIFILSGDLLSIFNYNDMAGILSNPAFICRDILEQWGGHNYADFDLNWNNTGIQIQDMKCRLVIDKTNTAATYINDVLRQFNLAFYLRFQKFCLFWICFPNFTTEGRVIKEKDIKEGSFVPGKETNQYFNSLTATYAYNGFTQAELTSDTYTSPNAVSANAGQEVNKDIDLAAVYDDTTINTLAPLFVRLSVPDPEFLSVTVGFRFLRSQIQDFVIMDFEPLQNIQTGEFYSGRRFTNVPCMIRSISYDLQTFQIQMKLWSLGTTPFPGYSPAGNIIGGSTEQITLTSVGRYGRIGPTGYITGNNTNSLTLANDALGVTAVLQASTQPDGIVWKAGVVVDVIDKATYDVVQTLTILSVSGQTITFTENLGFTPVNTVLNGAGFIASGHYLQFTSYDNSTISMKKVYASFGNPTGAYETNSSQELLDQQAGLHNFDDGGVPYVLYPADFTGT